MNSPIPVSNKKPTKQGFNFPTPDSKKKLTNKNFDFLALNSAKSEVMSDTNDFDYLPYRRPNVKTNYNQKNKSDAKSDPKTPIVTPRLKTLDSSDSRTPRVTLRDGGTNLAKDVKACIICGVINEDLYDQSKMTVTRILFPVRSKKKQAVKTSSPFHCGWREDLICIFIERKAEKITQFTKLLCYYEVVEVIKKSKKT